MTETGLEIPSPLGERVRLKIPPEAGVRGRKPIMQRSRSGAFTAPNLGERYLWLGFDIEPASFCFVKNLDFLRK